MHRGALHVYLLHTYTHARAHTHAHRPQRKRSLCTSRIRAVTQFSIHPDFSARLGLPPRPLRRRVSFHRVCPLSFLFAGGKVRSAALCVRPRYALRTRRKKRSFSLLQCNYRYQPRIKTSKPASGSFWTWPYIFYADRGKEMWGLSGRGWPEF